MAHGLQLLAIRLIISGRCVVRQATQHMTINADAFGNRSGREGDETSANSSDTTIPSYAIE
jgi:hypothetical protein